MYHRCMRAEGGHRADQHDALVPHSPTVPSKTLEGQALVPKPREPSDAPLRLPNGRGRTPHRINLWAKRVLEAFLLYRVDTRLSIERTARVRELVVASSLIVLLGFFWAISMLSYGQYTIACSLLLLLLGGSWLSIAARNGRHLDELSNVAMMLAFVGFTIMNWNTGGLARANLGAFFFLLPLAMILTRRLAWLWVLLTFGVLAVFTALTIRGYRFPDVIPESDRSLDLVVSWLTTFLTLVGSLYFYERQRTVAEAAIVEAKKRAEAASLAKSDFLANMSHEIRTPMNGVISMAELLQTTQLSTLQKARVETILRSAECLLTILNDILDLSKIEAGKLGVERISVDLRKLVEDTSMLFAGKAQEKDLELILHCASDIPKRIVSDPVRLRQILSNLLGNAIKFTQEGHVLVKVTCVNDTHFAKTTIRVQDSGIGIPNEKLASVFDKFVQADDTITRKHGGTGLGLAVTKQLVHMLGGHIAIESILAQGSTFTVSIPFPIERSGERHSSLPPALPTDMRALVVDSSALSRAAMDDILKFCCVPHELAKDGAEGLKAIDAARARGEPIDVVLIDHRLAGMSPECVANAIRANPSGDNIALALVCPIGVENEAGNDGDTSIFKWRIVKPLRATDVGIVLRRIASSPPSSKTDPPRSVPQARTESIDRQYACCVLVVEDNAINQMVARELLTTLGCTVELAENGIEGVQRVREKAYDVVFMDCQMPEMDGFAATRAIRELDNPSSRVPIIAMTANAMKGDREQCLAAGMDEYISKPIKLQALRALLDRYLRG